MSIKIINISNCHRAGIAAGYDNIPIGIVKETIDLIMVSDPFCHIINLSISSGVVPDQLKIAPAIRSLRLVINVVLVIIDRCSFYRYFSSYLNVLYTIVF